jgi:hypothetical protein
MGGGVALAVKAEALARELRLGSSQRRGSKPVVPRRCVAWQPLANTDQVFRAALRAGETGRSLRATLAWTT